VNTAFVQNNANVAPDVFGDVTSYGCNLVDVSTGSGGWIFCLGGDILDPPGGTNFGGPANNGGPTLARIIRGGGNGMALA
jgi:hypothetical protein